MVPSNARTIGCPYRAERYKPVEFMPVILRRLRVTINDMDIVHENSPQFLEFEVET
jgi:hypothetical protein